ncbi:hypothetical protein AKJ43_01095 [candidate division MSBL1 archaeon SCGC-AAA261D19]|uniref:Transposase IS4-like domain-containing protein n=1 Tax=candidate division MSBL1 archaeon SCGC-AAA261D19 TaxID=1698273 RepID=A0A133V8A1_9EURY|nr:hypothetical protein AKJ43_01095 [candidate division MSBL1 archaeon SCGC-AAA261D19]
MLEATELTRLVVNKTVVPERRGRGRRGYGRRPAVRLLVYAQLKGIHRDARLVKHLQENPEVAGLLGLNGIPDRTTIERWRKRLSRIFEKAFQKLSEYVQMLVPTEDLIVDSTPLEDYQDPDARWGKYSRGWFKGFKEHFSVNQLELPLKTKVTTGNRHDSPFLPELIGELGPNRVLTDAGYDSGSNRKACRKVGATPHIARNPRNTGENYRLSKVLKKGRSAVERFNSRLKEMLQGSWQRFKGLTRKATVIYLGLIAMTAIALHGLILGEQDLIRKVSLYRD